MLKATELCTLRSGLNIQYMNYLNKAVTKNKRKEEKKLSAVGQLPSSQSVLSTVTSPLDHLVNVDGHPKMWVLGYSHKTIPELSSHGRRAGIHVSKLSSVLTAWLPSARASPA